MRVSLVALLSICAAWLAGGCSSDSGTNYTQAVASSNCDKPRISVGSAVEPIVLVRNTSGHDWKETWVWINGADGLHNKGLSMNNLQADATYKSAGQWNLGPLAAGDSGAIHLHYVADKIAAPTVRFEVWGASGSGSSEPSIPSNAPAAACSYDIR